MSIYVIPSEIEAEAMQATPHIELIAQIMSSVVPKNEREWAASREIERLRAEVARLREALHTAREGLAHIKAVARLHAEGIDELCP